MAGVWGNNYGTGYGVRGSSINNTGIGVYGEGQIGVSGHGTSGYGVQGKSITGIVTYFYSLHIAPRSAADFVQ